MMLCMLAMRNKGLKGKYKETGVTESEGNRTAGTKRERNANKQFMGNGWMEWAGKRKGALMKKMREMEGKGMDGKCVDN